MSKRRKRLRDLPKGDALPASQEPKRPSRYLHLVPFALIVILSLLAYSNTFYAPFHFDDWPNIIQNRYIHLKTLAPQAILQMVRGIYPETIRLFSYFTLGL